MMSKYRANKICMSLLKKHYLAICIVASFPAATLAKETDKLQKLSSSSMEGSIDAHQQTDNSRIYLEQGAIWASRDITKFSPVLAVGVSDEAEIEDGKLASTLNFSIDTNYGYNRRWRRKTTQRTEENDGENRRKREQKKTRSEHRRKREQKKTRSEHRRKREQKTRRKREEDENKKLKKTRRKREQKERKK